MSYTLSRRRFGAALAGVLGVAALGGCAADATTASSGSSTSGSSSSAGATIFDGGTVHDITLAFDDGAYDAMIEAYLKDGTKDWIEATVTIDGSSYEKAGLRLKGNSSLRGLSGDDSPQDLPWLIRLDKFVDGRQHQGYAEFVVRSNNTASALNEAVALELLGRAGLATEKSFSTSLSVNGGDRVLRLVVENPGDKWDADNFTGAGLLYKAESGGDYSYRGDDAASYEDVFDQEAGEDDLTPLIAFLEFINESDDATFGADLGKYLDVDAFATYLAFQDLVQNSDDIDGPGNNSYLRYTADTKIMTVVNWDLNLAFGGMGGGRDGGGDGGVRPQPSGMPGNRGGGRGGRSNILVTRFQADDVYAGKYTQAQSDLKEALYTSGVAQTVLDRRAKVLTEQASDLVSADTITSDASKISAYFSG
ncbi:CotH kinase family protein [Actinoplanes sp. NPDC023714]|uniref:CotH kinase family protein n=1 Tax=Actinoplanes sp. NPDC023714 TaxID=3154322 RepID=UPI0033FB5567